MSILSSAPSDGTHVKLFSSSYEADLEMVQASILDQAWGGALPLPTREEVAAIPMPQLPNLEPPSPKTHFETIAQYLQVAAFKLFTLKSGTACKLLLLLCYCCCCIHSCRSPRSCG